MVAPDQSSRCIHCEALKDEVAELRAALGLSGQLTERRKLQRRFGLTATESHIAQILYDAGGRTVPRVTLDNTAIPGGSDGADSLKTHVCRIRRKLSADSIDTAEGGYRMSPVGRALIYTALKVSEP